MALVTPMPAGDRRECEVGLNVRECENRAFESISTTCYRCGSPACRSCSTIVTARVNGEDIKIRRCNDCAGFYQDEQGNNMSDPVLISVPRAVAEHFRRGKS